MWGQTQGGGFMGIPTYFLMELRQHIVVIRFSDGELLKFKMKVLLDNSLVFPIGKMSLSAGFVPMDTTKGTLEALDFDSKHLLLLFGQLYYENGNMGVGIRGRNMGSVKLCFTSTIAGFFVSAVERILH